MGRDNSRKSLSWAEFVYCGCWWAIPIELSEEIQKINKNTKNTENFSQTNELVS